MKDWLLYGANGYTGELIARAAAARGMRPILAGRDATAVRALADELRLEARVFALDAPDLQNVGLVLHCAGPFIRTSTPMVAACLAARAHYLDITGEIAVFESIYARDSQARAVGVALIPGVGFDVVPTDCLAADLARRMPDATELRLAFSTSRGSSVSRGTARTMIEGLGQGGAIRRDGRIVRVPIAFDVMTIPFPGGNRTAMTIPWGDISSAYRTTGIPDIRVYSAASPRAIARVRRIGRFERVLAFNPVKSVLARLLPPAGGPGDDQRARNRVALWGSVRNERDELQATMTTPDGYAFTVEAALGAVARTLTSTATGALTPSQAFGLEFASSLPGVVC